MKKVLLCLGALLFGLISGCGGGSGSSSNNTIVHNTINGKQLLFMPTSNFDNVSSDANGLILKTG